VPGLALNQMLLQLCTWPARLAAQTTPTCCCQGTPHPPPPSPHQTDSMRAELEDKLAQQRR